jgi:hypothetical protein
MSKAVKILTVSIVLFGIFIFLYWMKCQNRIDIFQSFRWEKYLPLQAFQRKIPVLYAFENVRVIQDDFEKSSLSGWSKLWSRSGTGQVELKRAGIQGSRCAVIEHQGNKDWSFQRESLIKVLPRQGFEYRCTLKTEGEVEVTVGVILYDDKQEPIDWHYAAQGPFTMLQWKELQRSFFIPKNGGYVRFRVSGSGSGKVFVNGVSLQKTGDLKNPPLEENYFLENGQIKYELNLSENRIRVTLANTGKPWISYLPGYFYLLDIRKVSETEMRLELMDIAVQARYEVSVSIRNNEIHYTIHDDFDRSFESLVYPSVFYPTREDGFYLLPFQQGLLMNPEEVRTDFSHRYSYSGAWSMPFIGILEAGAGFLQIVETPDDFEIDFSSENGPSNRWISQKGKFGYDRKIRHIFFADANYVTLAKYYREYAKTKGWIKTLREKNSLRNGNIEKLIGAVDIWYWGKAEDTFLRELRDLGIKKILFSSADEPKNIELMNEYGILTSRYDIYQDTWPPEDEAVSKNHEGWPDDLVLDHSGDWIKGWTVLKEGKEYPGGVVCSVPGLARANERIRKELGVKKYSARFIDTVATSSWKECFNPRHPTTRSEDLRHKMNLLQLCSENFHLVTGSEDGVADAVPSLDYLEGMMSLHAGRLPDSGRNVGEVKYVAPTDSFLKYQLGHGHRVPLWELVFHDCVVSTWYWGDSSNRIPEGWAKRDLFNILYGNMNLWAIPDDAYWERHKDRFSGSYRNVNPVFEKVGFEEMLSHRFLSPDRAVQETRFTGDIRILVNFGDKDYQRPDNQDRVKARGYTVFQGKTLWKEGVSL